MPATRTGDARIAGKAPAYTEADTDATIDGIPILWEDSSDTLRVPSSSKPLPVNPVASARTTDSISSADATDAIMSNLTALTPKFFTKSVTASSTDASLIAAVASKKLRIVSLAVQAGGTATDLTFESDGVSDTKLHKVQAGANGGQILPYNPVGWFETLSGEALLGTTGAGSTVEITGTYIEV